MPVHPWGLCCLLPIPRVLPEDEGAAKTGSVPRLSMAPNTALRLSVTPNTALRVSITPNIALRVNILGGWAQLQG